MGLSYHLKTYENQTTPGIETSEDVMPKPVKAHHTHQHHHSHHAHQHQPEKSKQTAGKAYRMKDGVLEPFAVNTEQVSKNTFTPASTQAFSRSMVSIMRLQKRGMDDMAAARLREKMETDAEFRKNWIAGMHDAESKKEMIRQISRASAGRTLEPMSKGGVENRLERLRKLYAQDLDKKFSEVKPQLSESTKKQEPAPKSTSIFDDIDSLSTPIEVSKTVKKTDHGKERNAEAHEDGMAKAIDGIASSKKSAHQYDLCTDRVKEEAADDPIRGSQMAALCNDVFDTKLPTKHAIVTDRKVLSKREPKEQAQFAATTKKAVSEQHAKEAKEPDTLKVRGLATDTSVLWSYKAAKYEAHKEGLITLPSNEFAKLQKEKPIRENDVLVSRTTGEVIEEKLKPIFKSHKTKSHDEPQQAHYAKL